MKLLNVNQKPLKIVVIENLFENWQTPHIPEYLKSIVGLKHDGYEGFYSTGFLPVDTSDFVGTHHLICQESPTGWAPIAGFRSITLKQCNTYRLMYPSVSIATKCPGAKFHLPVVQQIIQNATNANKTLSYGSSWTIHPEARNKREDVELIKDIARAMLVHYQLDNKIDEEMCCGLLKAKTDVYFSELGYNPISLNGQELPAFEDTNLDNRLVKILHRVQFTEFAMTAAARYQDLWENKILIGGEAEQNNIKKAA